MKKIVERTCIGCNEKKDKRELIRIVKNKEGKISIDKTGKLPGRGAYICGDKECTEKIIKQKKLNKTFEMNITDEVYENLRGVVFEQSK